MSEIEQIKQAIQHLEAQRAALGNEVVEAALGPLRERLAALEQKAQGSGTRRQVTVLFADVSGFTAMAESSDHEVVRDTMNALWQKLDAAITTHGGRVDKHLGDGVMALWGAEAVREDDAEQAVRAALAIQEAIAGFDSGAWARLVARIGINTGPAMLGTVGTTGEFTAMGDTVNTASRLQARAPVGGVLISHGTYRQVRGIFDVTPTAPLSIHGKAEPVQAYVVGRAKPVAFRAGGRGVEGIETEMVGRDAELGRLQEALVTVFREKRTALVTVCGEAGVGKSRLLFEFENWLELRPEQWLLYKARAQPATKEVPFRLLRDVFAARFGILESDHAHAVLDKFRDGAAKALTPDQADIAGQMLGFDFRQSPAVAALLGSTSFGKQASLALAELFRRTASEPMLLFLEDIHWADDSSLDFIVRLIQEVPEAPLLTVCLARPHLFERRPDWAKGKVRIDLKPLSVEHSREMVAQVLKRAESVPDRLRDLIVDGAEGNPYYVEELVKMLMDEGVIARGPERWSIELDRLSGIKVPATLTGILQARLDSLPPGERDVLQRASVVGRRFWDAAVARLQGGEAAGPAVSVWSALESMQRRELVFRNPRSAFEGCQEYLFKHALLRDVAYETVLLKVRRELHSLAAQWLEDNAGERLAEYLGLMAHHCEQAGETAKAARYLRKQANVQYRSGSYRDAFVLYQRALALCPPDDKRQRAVLCTHLGNTLRQLSDFAASREFQNRALALAREVRDVRAEVNALEGLSWALMGQGRYEDAKRSLDLALAHATRTQDRLGMARVLARLGDVAYRQGDGRNTAMYGAECLKLYQELGYRQGIANALRVIGFSHFMEGRYDEAFHYQTQSKSVFAQIGDRWGVASGSANQGESMRRQDRFAEAAAHYQEAMAVYEEIGHRLGVSITLLNLGHVYAGLDDDARARQYYRLAAEQSWSIGANSVLLEVLAGYALLEARSGSHLRAAEILGMVQAHPEYNDEIRANALPATDILLKALGRSGLAVAMERGRAQHLSQMAKELLASGR